MAKKGSAYPHPKAYPGWPQMAGTDAYKHFKGDQEPEMGAGDIDRIYAKHVAEEQQSYAKGGVVDIRASRRNYPKGK